MRLCSHKEDSADVIERKTSSGIIEKCCAISFHIRNLYIIITCYGIFSLTSFIKRCFSVGVAKAFMKSKREFYRFVSVCIIVELCVDCIVCRYIKFYI